MSRLFFWLGVRRILLRWWWRDASERLLTGVVWRLPRPLVYWAFVRLAVFGCSDVNPADQTVGDVMKRTQDWAHG